VEKDNGKVTHAFAAAMKEYRKFGGKAIRPDGSDGEIENKPARNLMVYYTRYAYQVYPEKCLGSLMFNIIN
jgi:hypothetical protein